MSDYLRPLCDSGQALRPCKLHHAVHQRLHGERQEAVVRLLVEAAVPASDPRGVALAVVAALHAASVRAWAGQGRWCGWSPVVLQKGPSEGS